ncbi:MAG: E3 binding domain-containing protein, partial [Rhodospirillales bacterium]|nr:E3 binding domain-containing protein [Rhodospirillales bacterium]
MSTFVLPDLGEGLHEAEIVSWHVSSGDHVVADQPLLSVETDKAVVEVPSPQSGRIAKVFGEIGDFVQVGSPLVEFTDGAPADTGTVVGEIAPKAKNEKGKAKAAPAVRSLAKDLGIDLETISGSGPGGTITKDDVEKAAGGGAIGAAEP